MTRKEQTKLLKSLKKELPVANNIPDEIHLEVGMFAKTFMRCPPKTQRKIKEESDKSEKEF